MRADVNLSVREVGAEEFGTRTEMKNLNSFKAIKRAIEGEMERQIDLIEAGEKVVQETRRWDDTKGASYAMRSKEDAQDYRYFPDPDLVPIEISDEWMDKVRAAQPEFRDEKKVRYKEEYDLPDYDIDIITGSKHLADIFEASVVFAFTHLLPIIPDNFFRNNSFYFYFRLFISTKSENHVKNGYFHHNFKVLQ